jgi:tetratricopeptide (TPR) repeat protein
MGDGSEERMLTLSTRRCYRTLVATLAFAISGCATTVGLGQSELREGRYIEAANNFERALREHPERPDALVGLGIVRYAQGSYDEAVALLSRALDQDPRRADAQLYLGLSCLERGDDGCAAEHLRAFRGLTHNARVTRQVDEALQLMRTEHPLSSQSRRFVATSLESAVKAEQELQDARSAYAALPYPGDTDWFLGRWTW